MARAFRFDRGALIQVHETRGKARIDAAPAYVTPEGFLEVDAILARDGLLTYSDGKTSWNELRPREELERTVDEWRNKTVTDDHPDDLISAESWRETARGFVLDGLSLSPPDSSGTSYLYGRLRINDAELIAIIREGKREVSIGMEVDVEVMDGMYRGVPYKATQTALSPNHVAIVDVGRAGRNVRVLLDSAPKTRKVDAMDPEDDKKKEDVEPTGETTETEVTDPVSGQKAIVPTWVAALIAKTQAQPPAPPAPMPPPAPPAPAPIQSMDAKVQRRVTLVRAAERCKVEDADRLDNKDLAIAILKAVDPKNRYDSMDSEVVQMTAIAVESAVDRKVSGGLQWGEPRTDSATPKQKRARADGLTARDVKVLIENGYR